jgi:CDP-glucose 4,6-dehydratase
MLQLQPARFAGAWNFGPRNDETMTVEELVKTFIQNWGGGEYEISKAHGQPHEAGLLQLDISRAKEILHWEPKLDIKKTLAWVTEEYKALASGNGEIIFQHIGQYQTVVNYQPAG